VKIVDAYLRVREHAQSCGLSQGAVTLLLSLMDGDKRVTALAEETCITQQAVGKTLRKMALLGYVSIEKDKVDRRAKTIKILSKGRTQVRQIIKEW